MDKTLCPFYQFRPPGKILAPKYIHAFTCFPYVWRGGGSRPLIDNFQKMDAFFLMSSLSRSVDLTAGACLQLSFWRPYLVVAHCSGLPLHLGTTRPLVTPPPVACLCSNADFLTTEENLALDPVEREVGTAALLHCCTAAPLHRCTAAPLHRCTAAPLHRFTAAPLHCCTAALLHCCTAALLHCCWPR